MHIEVINIHGQRMLHNTVETIGNGQYKVDVSSLAAGVYLLKASDTTNQWTHKIIVN